MPRLVYEGKLPSPEQFKADWAHALATTSPIDDLLELAAELKDFEQKYNMTSQDFYLRYQAGVLNDELQHCMEWAMSYNTFVKTKRLLEVALMQMGVNQALEKVMA